MSLLNNVSGSSQNEYWLTRSYLPDDIKRKVEPYLLPYDHPARERLDRIYSQCDTGNLSKERIGSGQHMIALKYQELTPLGLIVKQPCDDRVDTIYKELLRRAEAHKAARQLIEEKKITCVKVPQNWLYPLPTVKVGKIASVVHFVCKLIRSVFKCFNYSNSTSARRFIIVEQFVEIIKNDERKLPKLIKNTPSTTSDEWEEVFKAVGFRDSTYHNLSLDDDGTITLFDLGNYSHKSEKNTHNGQMGIDHLLAYGQFYSEDR